MTHTHANGNGPRTAVLPLGAITLAADPERLPASPAESSGVMLTGKGEAYAARVAKLATLPRDQIEASIEQHLALVQTLIAWLDDADGDCDLEPSLAGFDGGPHDDREGGDVDTTEISDLEHYGESDGLEHGEHDWSEYDSGALIVGGGSGKL